MADTACSANDFSELNRSVLDRIALPANHVVVSDQGVRFSRANLPVPDVVLAAARRLCAALTHHAVPEDRATAVKEAGRCLDQMRVLGRLVTSINDAKALCPDRKEAMEAVSGALDEFLKVWTQPGVSNTRDADGAWHKAVLDACIVRESCYVPDDPEKTVRQLLEWEAACATDPTVSDRAAALVGERSGESFDRGARASDLTSLHLPDTASPAASGACHCHRCVARIRASGGALFPATLSRMIVCPECGNKRCPHARDHTLQCTDSNEPGQAGSGYE